MNKDEELFGLMKVPDDVIIEELRTQLKDKDFKIGQYKSYIDELEHKLSGESQKEIKLLKNEINGLKGSIKKMIEERNSTFFYKLYKGEKEKVCYLRKKISELTTKQLNIDKNSRFCFKKLEGR